MESSDVTQTSEQQSHVILVKEQQQQLNNNNNNHQLNGHNLANGVTELHDEDMTPPSVNGHATGHENHVNGHTSPVLDSRTSQLNFEDEILEELKTEPEPITPEVVKPEADVEPETAPVRPQRRKSPAPLPPKTLSVHTESLYFDGPDQVIITDNLYTTVPDGAIKLRLGTKGVAAEQPMSVVTMLNQTAELLPDHTAMAVKRNGEWIRTSFLEYRHQVHTVAKAFIKLGLERFHSVCILGFNSPEWFVADLAAIHAGGLAAGIYTTNSAEACFYCAENSRANIIVVEDAKQLEKILQVRSRLPHLKAIVQYIGKPQTEGVLSWEDLIKLGREQSDDELKNRIKQISVNQCCTLVYTSGTTGNPKGVMLSHDNLSWDAKAIGSYLEMKRGCEDIISYLPLSHVAAQLVDLFMSISYGVTVHFAQPDALKGTLVATLAEVRPTKFLGVPRVWEKIYEKMTDIGRTVTGVKKTLSTWAKKQGYQHNIQKMNGNDSSTWSYSLAHYIVLSKVKKALGLDRCNIHCSSAAPISVEIVKYFMSLDIPIMEAYGMSEAAGCQTLNTPSAFRLESVGRTLPGMQTLIFEPDNKKQGEICTTGRQVFMGYLHAEEKTKECIDADGWLHSGDIGRVDEDGYLYITGRIKELLITAGGENVAPVPIEDVVKAELSCVSNAMLIGDRRKFLTVLLTLKTNTNLDTGEPMDKLSSGARAWCEDIGSSATTVSEIINGPDEKVMKELEAGIVRANKQAISNAQKIQKFKLLPKDFSIPGGELGPTMKIKRNVVHDMYNDLIEEFYV